jgi:hypothetical protein
VAEEEGEACSSGRYSPMLMASPSPHLQHQQKLRRPRGAATGQRNWREANWREASWRGS